MPPLAKQALIAKAGGIATRIEDTVNTGRNGSESCDDMTIAICHAGADLFLRTAYNPAQFSHRVLLLNNECDIIGLNSSVVLSPHVSTPNSASSALPKSRPPRVTTIAGPLCFSGDVIASKVILPQCFSGDR